MEIWKDIKGYEDYYQVSNKGNVRSKDRTVNHKGGSTRFIKGKILRHGTHQYGYTLAVLCIDYKRKTHYIHQLVAIAFLDHKPNGYELVVDHIDNNPKNNKVENLQLITQRQNSMRQARGKSKFVGVQWSNQLNKWTSAIMIDGKQKRLGSYETELEAKIAYEEKYHEITNK